MYFWMPSLPRRNFSYSSSSPADPTTSFGPYSPLVRPALEELLGDQPDVAEHVRRRAARAGTRARSSCRDVDPGELLRMLPDVRERPPRRRTPRPASAWYVVVALRVHSRRDLLDGSTSSSSDEPQHDRLAVVAELLARRRGPRGCCWFFTSDVPVARRRSRPASGSGYSNRTLFSGAASAKPCGREHLQEPQARRRAPTNISAHEEREHPEAAELSPSDRTTRRGLDPSVTRRSSGYTIGVRTAL